MPDGKRASDTAFLGHPAGLGWLSFTEFWERFSYYGMTSLLVLYLTHVLMTPGHIEHVAALAPFRFLVSLMYGHQAWMTGQPLASAIYGFYTSIVYLTPLAGGWIADRFIGRTSAITIGASLMALGHFLMAFEVSFVFALFCLLFGVGFFKGNIASQVGDLYKRDDPRRADAFQIFLLGIQIAVIASPIVCSTLAATMGWDWGFGAAGVGMLIGLAIYLSGRYALPKEQASPSGKPKLPPLGPEDWRKVTILVSLLPVLAVGIIGNQQIGNAYLVWAERSFGLTFFGLKMPPSYLVSLDAAISAVTLIMVVAFWRWWGRRWAEPDEITKIAIGVALSALGPLLLAAAAAIVAGTGHPASLGWAIGFHIVNDLGFANVLPVGLALYSRAAPKGLTGVIVGVYYLHLVLGNWLVGYVGGLLDAMPSTLFWLLHVGLMTAAAAILLAVRFTVGRTLAPAYAEPELAADAAE